LIGDVRVRPSSLHSIAYEDIVSDIESYAREIINFIELPWDGACLDFYKTKGQVQTASRWQVRNPVYSTSVGKWRNYENMLGPLISELEKK